MSRTRIWWVVALALALVVPAVAEDGEEKKVRKIEIRKHIECGDGEDCDERVSRVVFVGDDGDVRVLHGDDAEWVSGDDHVRVLEADGHEVVLSEDVRGGEDGESVRRRVHRVMKRLGERGARLHLRHGGGAFLGVQLSDLTPGAAHPFRRSRGRGRHGGQARGRQPGVPCRPGGRRHRHRGRRGTGRLRVVAGAGSPRPGGRRYGRARGLARWPGAEDQRHSGGEGAGAESAGRDVPRRGRGTRSPRA